jgi:hypothetical protein
MRGISRNLRGDLNPEFPSGALKLPADDFVCLLLRFVVGGDFPLGKYLIINGLSVPREYIT